MNQLEPSYSYGATLNLSAGAYDEHRTEVAFGARGLQIAADVARRHTLTDTDGSRRLIFAADGVFNCHEG